MDFKRAVRPRVYPHKLFCDDEALRSKYLTTAVLRTRALEEKVSSHLEEKVSSHPAEIAPALQSSRLHQELQQ